MAEIRETFLIFVDIKKGVQSNKYYNMYPTDSSFRVEYGRVGSTKTTMTYPISKWNSIYGSKTKKGYKDVTDLKVSDVKVSEQSGNQAFDEFFEIFSRYIGNSVKRTYMVEGCTQKQLDEAQKILDNVSILKDIDEINQGLLDLYKIIPRRMSNVRDHLISSIKQLNPLVIREQDALDSMDSSNIMHVSNPFKELSVGFDLVDDHEEMERLLYPTRGYKNINIHKVYRITHPSKKKFDKWVSEQDDQTCELLIHGTRNPNVFSILKSGLLVRPSNAATYSGSAYGDGVYHSAHTQKSLGYTGGDNDKIFFIQNVHMGKKYTYEGWYRDGKDLSKSEMNYVGLKQRGYDSLYVKPGDGLLNSEYIVYKSEQTVTNYLVWMK